MAADDAGDGPAGREQPRAGRDQKRPRRGEQGAGRRSSKDGRSAGSSAESAPEENPQAKSDRREPAHPADPYENFDDSMEERVSLTEALEQALRTFAPPQVQQWNQNVFYGTSGQFDTKQVSQPVPATLLEKIRRAFVQPPDYRDLLVELEKRSLMVLAARPGSGRHWTAQFLLDATCGGRVRSVHESQARAFTADAIDPLTGYLWAAPTAKALESIRSGRLDLLAAELRERGSRAVVLVPHAEVQSMSGILSEYLFILERPPDLTEVLRNHLRSLLGRSLGEEVDGIVSSPSVGSVLEELGRRDDTCRSVARFAEALKPVVEGMAILEVACRAAVAVPWRDDYFPNLKEPEEQEFAIALAVGANHTLSAVADLARNLGKRVQAMQEPDETPRVRVWCSRTEDLLSQVQAECFPTRHRTPFGLVPAVGVRSKIDGYPPLLMRMLWQQYPNLQPILLDWLQDLCTENLDPMVRSNAAAAIGVIGNDDFQLVYRKVIAPWSSSFQVEQREAAANILGLVARGGNLTGQVWELLSQWSEPLDARGRDQAPRPPSRDGQASPPADPDTTPGNVVNESIKVSLTNRRRRQLTAAVALGASVGITDVPRALVLLEQQAGEAHAELSWVIGRSVVDLAYGSGDEEILRVVEALARWQGSNSRARVHAALGAFLQLVWIAANGGSGAPKSLRILRLSNEHNQLSANLARLWRRCLNSARYEHVAMEILRNWLRDLELDPSAENGFRDLVGQIPQAPRDFRVMRTYIAAWSHRGPDDKFLAFVRHVLDDRERSYA